MLFSYYTIQGTFSFYIGNVIVLLLGGFTRFLRCLKAVCAIYPDPKG